MCVSEMRRQLMQRFKVLIMFSLIVAKNNYVMLY